MGDNDSRQCVRNGKGFDEKWRCLHEGKHWFATYTISNTGEKD